MKFSRKINPEYKLYTNFLTKKRIREDEINFEKLRSYRLERVKKELIKNNLEACILFDPVNVRYALDTVNMSVFNMHNLSRYCFVPVEGPTILYEYFNCEKLSEHLNLIDEIRPAITWDYFAHGDQANSQLKKWITEVNELSQKYFKSKKIAGILSESNWKNGFCDRFFFGFGINIRSAPQEYAYLGSDIIPNEMIKPIAEAVISRIKLKDKNVRLEYEKSLFHWNIFSNWENLITGEIFRAKTSAILEDGRMELMLINGQTRLFSNKEIRWLEESN